MILVLESRINTIVAVVQHSAMVAPEVVSDTLIALEGKGVVGIGPTRVRNAIDLAEVAQLSKDNITAHAGSPKQTPPTLANWHSRVCLCAQ